MQALSDVSAVGLAPEIWGLAGIAFGALLGGAAQIVTAILAHRHSLQREHIQFKRDAYFETLTKAEELVMATQDTFRHAKTDQEDYDFDVYREWLGREVGALRAFRDSQLALEMYAPHQ